MNVLHMWKMLMLGFSVLLGLTSCSVQEQPVIPTPVGLGQSPIAIASSETREQNQTPVTTRTQPTPTIEPQTPRPLDCPSIPVYPQATRMNYEQSLSRVKRVAFYESHDSPAQILRWFHEHRHAPEWSWDGEGENWVRYTNRGPDEYNPAISLRIDMSEVQDGLTTFQVRLTIGHPHLNGDWCPDLEP